jgi:hypothetical protein
VPVARDFENISQVECRGTDKVRQTNMANKIRQEIISAAIEGFEAQKVRIDAQIAELRASLSGSGTETESSSAPPKRRTMSASARRRIAAAQRKRWAEAKRLAGTAAAPAAKTPRRKLSAAGRRRIIEANKKRWAAAKAASRKGAHKRSARRSTPAAAKKAVTAEKSAATQVM